DEEGHGARERAAPVLDEVDGGQHPDGHRDERGRPGDEERPDDRVVDAAGVRAAVHPAHRHRQEVRAEPLRAPRDDDPHQRDERHHGHRERPRDDDAHRAVDGATAPVGPGEQLPRRRARADRGDRAPRRLGETGRGGHQRDPPTARRATTQRAAEFTASVMTNSTSPVAINALTPSAFASGNCSATFAAIVWCRPTWSRARLYVRPGPRIMSTAMVSPRARPRPSIAALTTPDRPNGSTAIRTISHRVAPSASAASSCRRGVARNTSRETAVTMGRTITASTTPTVAITRGGVLAGPANRGTNPRWSASHAQGPWRRGASHSAPHRP